MIEKIRVALFKNALGKLLASQNRKRKTHTIDSAKTVGLLFDAETNTNKKEAIELSKQLAKNGKKVHLLGFFNSKQAPEDQAFDYFFLKELNWLGVPKKSEKAKAFLETKFDLLLSYNPKDLGPLEWMAAASPAAMKFGLATERSNDFDIQLELPEGKGIAFFAEQLKIYLDKIVLTT